MSRNIIIHAGWPKTGTSSVQNALYDNRVSLLNNAGILYPSIANFQSRMLVTMFRDNAAHQPMNKIQGVSDKSRLSKLAREYKTAYETEIQSNEWATLILSAEGLAYFSCEELENFRDWISSFSADHTVYLLVRHPVKFATSIVQQSIKAGQTLEHMYNKLPSRMLPDYQKTLARFISVFGKDNVKVDSFENAVKHPSGLMGYFANQWGMNEAMGEKLISEVRHDNKSLCMLSAQILSSINRQRPMYTSEGKGTNRNLAELNFLKLYDNGHKFRLPSDVVSYIIEKSALDMDWLAETYGITYPDMADQETDANQLWVNPTHEQLDYIDTLAIMISDLLNEQHFLRMKERARHLRRKGLHKQAELVMHDAQRVFPLGA